MLDNVIEKDSAVVAGVVGVGVGVGVVPEFPPPMGLTRLVWAVRGRAVSQLESVALVHSAVVAVVDGFDELPEE